MSVRHPLVPSPLMPLLAGVAFWSACTGPGSDTKTPGAPTLPTDAVIGVANIDDDDGNGEADWDDAGVDGENDRVVVDLGGFGSLRLAFVGGAEGVRVWQGGEIVLDADTLEATVDDGAVEVEFEGFLDAAELSVTPVDQPEAAVTLALRSAPLILNHHLQGAERVMAMEAGGRDGNTDFVEGFSEPLGDAFFTGSLNTYGYDVWVQDEIEFATLSAPGHQMDVVIDSIRTNNNRYLDKFAENELEAPDFAVRTWGSGRATSQDSFGNLEASPPVTVDGVEYPFGRVYWGETGSWGVTDDLGDMLVDQKVQAPFQVDIRWLCVGHVDEFASFVPDPTSEKGFRFLYADTNLGRSFLAGLDPTTPLPRYDRDHGYDTIGDIVGDGALWAYNEDLQADYLDPNLEIFQRELGLVEDDIIRIPAVFEESGLCGGGALSLIPGTVNLVVADLGDDATHVFLADPFLREDDGDPSTDPLIAEVARLLPSSLTLHWLDDWDWYHVQWGEVHCGSNTVRAPREDWWTAAAHLLEAE